MFKNTRKFLIISFSFLIVVCILSFMAIAIRIGRKSNDAVSDVGMLYMSEMNRQLQEKYTTVIELRLTGGRYCKENAAGIGSLWRGNDGGTGYQRQRT